MSTKQCCFEHICGIQEKINRLGTFQILVLANNNNINQENIQTIKKFNILNNKLNSINYTLSTLFSFLQAAFHVAACKLLNKLKKQISLKIVSKIKTAEHSTRLSTKTI